MPVAVAFCPCPPLLVPDVAAGAAAELDELRAACSEAVEGLVRLGPRRVLVLGAGEPPGRWGAEAGGSMRRYGVDVRCGGPQGDLPLALTIGAHLLDRTGWIGDRAYVAVAGQETLDTDDAWLVMADGTAKRTDTAPGHVDERATGWDTAVAQALAAGDAAALAGLDLALASELWCAGAPAWQVVGRSLAASAVHEATLLAEQAPYGVGYLVANWILPAG